MIKGYGMAISRLASLSEWLVKYEMQNLLSKNSVADDVQQDLSSESFTNGQFLSRCNECIVGIVEA